MLLKKKCAGSKAPSIVLPFRIWITFVTPSQTFNNFKSLAFRRSTFLCYIRTCCTTSFEALKLWIIQSGLKSVSLFPPWYPALFLQIKSLWWQNFDRRRRREVSDRRSTRHFFRMAGATPRNISSEFIRRLLSNKTTGSLTRTRINPKTIKLHLIIVRFPAGKRGEIFKELAWLYYYPKLTCNQIRISAEQYHCQRYKIASI